MPGWVAGVLPHCIAAAPHLLMTKVNMGLLAAKLHPRSLPEASHSLESSGTLSLSPGNLQSPDLQKQEAQIPQGVSESFGKWAVPHPHLGSY